VVPVWGAVVAFGAPVLALTGIVLGGLAMSEANRRGQPTGFAVAGVIMNLLAFVPAAVVAMTCGVCNAFMSTGDFQQVQQFQWNPPTTQGVVRDSGTPPPPPFDDLDDTHDGEPLDDDALDDGNARNDKPRDDKPSDQPVDEPQALPPPPIAPGPGR
jgi:hypothetical protein